MACMANSHTCDIPCTDNHGANTDYQSNLEQVTGQLSDGMHALRLVLSTDFGLFRSPDGCA